MEKLAGLIIINYRLQGSNNTYILPSYRMCCFINITDIYTFPNLFSYFCSQPCTQSLETLNLGHNSIGNEGVHKLKDGLIANRSVLRLGLASTKLSCEGE